jgi:type IV pilus assembly protein PilE
MKNKGFTLIELMVVVAIIGILVTIVLPGYRSYISEGQRSDMQVKLLSIAELQERYYLNNFSYANDMKKLGFNVPDGSAYTYEHQGIDSFTVKVDLCIGAQYPDNPTIARCFMLNAKAKGDQADDGDLLIDSRGRKEHILPGNIKRDWSGNDL